MKTIKANCHKTGVIHDVIVDDEDFLFVSRWKWHLNCNGYAYRQFRDETGKCVQIFLHRVIAQTPDDLFTDHINQNKLDNRRSNLRLVTKSQNAINSKPRKSISGITGVRTHPDGRITARITLNQKEIHLGSFDSIDLAIAARNLAAKELHGQYRPL